MKKILILIFTLTLCSCSGKFINQVNFDTKEPLRIAIMPFAYVDEKGEIVELKPDLLIDDVAIISTKLADAPANYVRDITYSTLDKSGLDLVPPAVLEADLSHHGYSDKNVLDIKKIYSIDYREIGKLLNCDAILYGFITSWDRSYYGIQTVNTVGIKMRLVSVKTGKDLFFAEAEETDSRGITKGPTGWTSLIIEPVKGLDNEIIAELAKNTVNKMLAPLFVKKKSDVLTEPAPVILASSHDDAKGVLDRNGCLTVLVLGSPKKNAFFSIGDKIKNIPMIEKEDSHYIGEYYPLSSDVFYNEDITVTLIDKYGRSTSQKV